MRSAFIACCLREGLKWKDAKGWNERGADLQREARPEFEWWHDCKKKQKVVPPLASEGHAQRQQNTQQDKLIWDSSVVPPSEFEATTASLQT